MDDTSMQNNIMNGYDKAAWKRAAGRRFLKELGKKPCFTPKNVEFCEFKEE